MFHNGLNKEIIVEAAKELIEQDGFQAFYMRKLAEKLGILGIAWATPFADWIAFVISLVLIVPCLMKFNRDCGK